MKTKPAKFTVAKRLLWHELFDDNDNSYWEAHGPYEEGFQWRIRQRLSGNRVEFYDDSAEELRGDGKDFWPALHLAKAAMLRAHNNVINENYA